MKRYRIRLLQTAEGINLKKDKSKDIVTVFLCAKDLAEANEKAKKIAKALEVSTYVGMLEYVIKSVKIYKE